MTEDVAARVLAAIEARKARTERVRHWFGPNLVPVPVRQFTERGGECFATPAWVQVVGERVWDADEDLRRCEADRRTVERHGGWQLDPDGESGRPVCLKCDAYWPCPDLLDRAAAYDIEVTA